MSVHEKTFIHALGLFSTDPEKCRSCLEDKRLSSAEKIIIKCYFLLRSNRPQEVVDQISTLKGNISEVVQSQKCLLLGCSYNNLNRHRPAIEQIKMSLDLMRPYELPYFKMIALINLFTLFANTHNLEGMGEVARELEALRPSRPLDVVRIDQCLFQYQTCMGNRPASEAMMHQLKSRLESMAEADRVNFLTRKFQFCIKFREYQLAQEVLEEMSALAQKKFYSTQNYNYMRILLNHHLHNTPIYLVEKEFKDYPITYHQIKVIQLLEERNIESALEHWQKLMELNPAIYQVDFCYQGGEDLFSLCLNKHRSLQDQSLKALSESRYKSLFEILKTATAPVRKELLFELLWGRPPESKEDMVKLSQCLYHARKKFRFEVKSRKGCYLIEKVPSKKKISS